MVTSIRPVFSRASTAVRPACLSAVIAAGGLFAACAASSNPSATPEPIASAPASPPPVQSSKPTLGEGIEPAKVPPPSGAAASDAGAPLPPAVQASKPTIGTGIEPAKVPPPAVSAPGAVVPPAPVQSSKPSIGEGIPAAPVRPAAPKR